MTPKEFNLSPSQERLSNIKSNEYLNNKSILKTTGNYLEMEKCNKRERMTYVNNNNSLSKRREQFRGSTNLNSTISRSDQMKRSEKEKLKSRNGLNSINTADKVNIGGIQELSQQKGKHSSISLFQSVNIPNPDVIHLDLSGNKIDIFNCNS